MEGTDAKRRIENAVEALIKEGIPAEKITVRQIAERAGVGIGTINYHFQSRDKLVYETVNKALVGMAERLVTSGSSSSEEPFGKLRGFLIDSSDMLIPYYSLYKLQMNYELVQGDMQTPEYLYPLLKEIFGDKRSELEIRLAALQIVSTMQVIFVNPAAFKKYSGVDIFDKEQRDNTINIFLKNIFKGE
jgi:AcrR family transcriptional regulator